MTTTEDQLASTQAAIANLIDVHNKAYGSTSDEAWDQNPICGECRHAYPCEIRVSLSSVPLDALKVREDKAAADALLEAFVIVRERGRKERAAAESNDDGRKVEHSAAEAALDAAGTEIFDKALALR